jgi:hypothetical protein
MEVRSIGGRLSIVCEEGWSNVLEIVHCTEVVCCLDGDCHSLLGLVPPLRILSILNVFHPPPLSCYSLQGLHLDQ